MLTVNVCIAEFGSEKGGGADGFGKLEVVVEVLSFRLRHRVVGFTVPIRPAKVGHPKIGNLDAVVSCPEKVGRFDISVDNALIVEVL
jgi:hypothetical protein